ncbi:energy transducer TonB [Pseudomonas sp. P5_152]|uniref:energy transducer TonB n=1 Tax=Pseudomonas sp. P5_152 TaxID=3043442 RepID=UPI002A3678C0|nr:energy transducer TonB [Pseudomonas sp. P5_152]MDX9663867.1 energy transducer TonB [Pseudomonas sp. P5_152]
MTSMSIAHPALVLPRADQSGFWRNSLAAGLAVALHVLVLALLVHTWSVAPPPPAPAAVLRTQLVMLPPAPPAPVPAAEPLPAVVEPAPPAPVVAAPVPAAPAAVKPAVDPQIQARKLEQASLARKRVEEQRAREAEQQHQRVAQEQRSREAEQQRLAQQQADQAQRADQARQAAERTRQQAAADSRQYLPLSKEAPDYPQRALDKNIEGDCSVEYTVNPQGKVENPRVLDGCHPLFMRPSLAAANTFRYQPRMVDGRAVAVPAVRNTFHYRIK